VTSGIETDPRPTYRYPHPGKSPGRVCCTRGYFQGRSQRPRFSTCWLFKGTPVIISDLVKYHVMRDLLTASDRKAGPCGASGCQDAGSWHLAGEFRGTR
jgi:hypothetical protein